MMIRYLLVLVVFIIGCHGEDIYNVIRDFQILPTLIAFCGLAFLWKQIKAMNSQLELYKQQVRQSNKPFALFIPSNRDEKVVYASSDNGGTQWSFKLVIKCKSKDGFMQFGVILWGNSKEDIKLSANISSNQLYNIHLLNEECSNQITIPVNVQKKPFYIKAYYLDHLGNCFASTLELNGTLQNRSAIRQNISFQELGSRESDILKSIVTDHKE